MIRRFCDCCEREITDAQNVGKGFENEAKLTRARGTVLVKFDIKVTVAGKAWNGADLCIYCVIDAVKRLDDRDRDQPKAG